MKHDMDYQPIDVSACCNKPVQWLDGVIQPQVGDQSFQGLPFVVGRKDDDGEHLIGFDAEAGAAVVVPIGATARHVIFAHAVLASTIHDGGPTGTTVAYYTVRYGDGKTCRLPIRERFEIAAVPIPWGSRPFLAWPDQKDHMLPRYVGEFNMAGQRQIEVRGGGPMGYWLWAWKNDRPDASITSITLEPAESNKMVIGGITLSHLNELPFTPQARRPVKITLPKPEDANKDFDLEVEIDRGVATYPYALPGQSADAFVEGELKGWGETQNHKASPAYVEVGGNPSATITIKNNGKRLGKVNWGQLQKKGKVKRSRVQVEMADAGRNWTHVTVVDDQTGKPIPCRIHFRSPDGIPFQPHGHHDHVNSNLVSWHNDIGGDMRLGQITYAYIDGKCQGWLPRGEVIVDAARGFEYEPLRQKVEIKPGQRELTVRMKRWTNMNAKRWFSGDSHVHFLGSQGAHREAQGEDLNVVNLLQSQWGHLFTNTEDFIGRPTFSDDGNTIVYCSQENRQHLLGHLTLWGLKEPVMPWCSDGPGEAEIGGNLEVAMSHWADACHAQGGTVVIPHLPTPNGEPASLIATGRADAIEMLKHGSYMHQEYYRYLNCGYKLPLVGGTDKMSSDVPVGIYRTYAYIPDDQPFDYETWCRAVREGRTFLSGGPMIALAVNGAAIGDTINLPGNGGTVEVEATAESIFPIHTLQIVQEGKVVAQVEDRAGTRRLQLKEKIHLDHHTWLAARTSGPDYFNFTTHHDGWGRGIFAHTSPIYVAVGGEWWMFDKATAEYMLTLVDGTIQYIRDHARRYEPGTVTHHHNHHDHAEFLEEPFQQAAAAIHKRMHRLGVPH